MENLIQIGIIGLASLFGLLIIGFIFARLYKRATKEKAFVRTGLGGQKVIMDGGAIVLPVFHEMILVNMNTLKLEVSRSNHDSLITRDRMRVNVKAAFFVRVKQSSDAIGIAAQTLGQRTLNPDALKQLVEDKFVDSLRATAATMSMQELQDKRREFVQAVQNAVAEDLSKNGLELESVSLTSLDQTEKQFFNAENAFDAEGLTALTKATESRRKERNDIEQDTEVQVRTKNLEAKRQTLTITREEEFASLEQEREIANRKAEQATLIAKTEADRKREADEARIEADRQVKEKNIAAERAVKEAEIQRNLAIQTKEIDAKRETEVMTAAQRKAVEIANQETQIAIATKSREQSEADALANKALAEAAKAEELVITAREVTAAERQKEIELIDAQKKADQEAIAVRTAAQAEKEAAVNRAEATRVLAEADLSKMLAEAEGKAAINDALNKLSAEQINLQVRIELLRALPAIIEKASKPMEKIDSIKIVQVNGMNAGGTGTGSIGMLNDGPASLPDQVTNAALKYQVQKPLIEAIMKDAGLGSGDMTTIAQTLAGMTGSTQSASTAMKTAEPALLEAVTETALNR